MTTNRHSLPGPDGVYRRRYDWADVARHFEVYATGQAEAWRGTLPSHIDAVKANQDPDGFYGPPLAEVLNDLRYGREFEAGAYANLPAQLDGEGPAWRFNDEDGEYCHDLLLSGEPDYYLDRRPEPAKLGLHVHAEMSFVWSTDTATIQEYGAWVGGTLRAIQDQGYDVALAVTCNLNNLIVGERGRHEFIIQVSHFGQELHDQDYGVLFSAEGFRQVMFAAFCIPEVREDKTTRDSFGEVVSGQGWDADWDPDDRVLRFSCNSMGGAFPREDMDALVQDLAPGF